MLNVLQKNKELMLEGKCFISTRPLGKSDELAALLKGYGAQLHELPMIELSEKACEERCYQVLQDIDKMTHVAFTSAYGFEFFCQKINQHKHINTIFSKLKIASFGYKTSELIRSKGFEIDFDAQAKTGEEFADKLVAYLTGKDAKVIWATGALSSDNLVNKVSKVAQIFRINLYENSKPDNIDAQLIAKINQDDYDMLLLASPSAFNNLYPMVNAEKLRVICIGETTAKEVRKHGIEPLAVSEEPNATGVAKAILNYYKTN